MTHPAPSTVPELLALRAALSPDAAAFATRNDDKRWERTSWRLFHERTKAVARGLRLAGLHRGDRIALLAPVSLDWELLHHAALSMGAVVVGIDVHELPQRIAAMVEQAGVAAFATSDPRSLAALSEEQSLQAFWLPIGNVSDPGPSWLRRVDWATLERPSTPQDDAADGPDPGDTATIIFTSGTTGIPRGIAYRHDQLCLAVECIANAFPFVDTDSRLLCWLPLSNLFQRIVNLAGVWRGALTFLAPDPRRLMDLVPEIAPDVFVGVPRFYEKLYDGIREQLRAQAPLRRRMASWAWQIGRRMAVARETASGPPLGLRLAHAAADRLVLGRVRAVMGKRLRCMISGSAPLPRHLLSEFEALGWPVLEAYGLSENIVPMAMNRLDDRRKGSVGRPLARNEFLIAADGAISVRGPGVFGGYLGDSASPLNAQGYYPTGDLGYVDAAGYLYLTGRSSDIIKTSTGRRVAPTAIEATLSALPGIDQVVVVGNGRKYLVALATSPHSELDASAQALLQQAIDARLRDVSEADRPAAVGLMLQHTFTIECGELTTNLKLRRDAIEVRNAAFIEQLYAAAQGRPTGGLQPVLLVTEGRYSTTCRLRNEAGADLGIKSQ